MASLTRLANFPRVLVSWRLVQYTIPRAGRNEPFQVSARAPAPQLDGIRPLWWGFRAQTPGQASLQSSVVEVVIFAARCSTLSFTSQADGHEMGNGERRWTLVFPRPASTSTNPLSSCPSGERRFSLSAVDACFARLWAAVRSRAHRRNCVGTAAEAQGKQRHARLRSSRVAQTSLCRT